jgi:integrase
MPLSPELNVLYQQNYYKDNSKKLLRDRHLREINKGIKKSTHILKEYNITKDDVDITNTNIHPSTLLNLKSSNVSIVIPIDIPKEKKKLIIKKKEKVEPRVKPPRPPRPSEEKVKYIMDQITPILIDDVLEELKPFISLKYDSNIPIENRGISSKYFKNMESALRTVLTSFKTNDLKVLRYFDDILKNLKNHKDYKDSTILSIIQKLTGIIKRSKILKRVISPINIKQYEDYIQKYGEIENNKTLEKTTEKAVPWKDIVKFSRKYKRGTFEHLIVNLYINHPYLRDNWGNIRIIKFNNQNNLINDTDNFIVFKNQLLILNDFKGSTVKEQRLIPISKKIINLIKYSLKLNPRDYVITKDNNKSQEPYINGLSSIISGLFNGIGINGIRHSYASKLFNDDLLKGNVSIGEWKRYVDQFNHSVSTNLFNYVRTG